jgi:hypothetical protein
MRLPVPTEIFQQHVAVLGKTRSGKSSVMRLLVEALLRTAHPVCIIDPKGDWWGIKVSADGKGAGYPVVVFGGEHADVPITEHAGAHVAELFATGNRPCLVDLGGWTVGARTRFYVAFTEALFKHTKGLRHLVIDEIHNFCPKGRVFEGEMAKALHWTNRLASEGLGKGVAMLFASQRPQKVHNDTLTSAETLIAMRVIHPSDREAVSEWIKGCGDASGKEVLDTLAEMQRGEGWVWSPEIGFGPKRVQFPLFETYDSFRVQTAADTKRLKGWAEVDLEDVKAKLSAVIEQAKLEDPKALRAELLETRRQLQVAQRALGAQQDQIHRLASRPEKAAPSPVKASHVEALTKAAAELGRVAELARSDVEKAASRFENTMTLALAKAGNVAAAIQEAMRAPVQTSAPAVNAALVPLARTPHQPFVPLRRAIQRLAVSHQGDDGRISPVAQRILNALAELEQLGSNAPEPELVAVMAGYSNLRSKGFSNAIGGLRSRGYVAGTSLTPAGRDLAQWNQAPQAPRDVQERVCRLLGGASERILRPLIEAYPDKVERETIATLAGYENVRSKGFANAIGRLRSLGFIDYPEPGTLKAMPVLFLEQRP